MQSDGEEATYLLTKQWKRLSHGGRQTVRRRRSATEIGRSHYPSYVEFNWLFYCQDSPWMFVLVERVANHAYQKHTMAGL